MTFQAGWLQEQIDLANKAISEWSDEKRVVMLQEDQRDEAHQPLEAQEEQP